MSFFDDNNDQFEGIFREFSGNQQRDRRLEENIIQGEREERIIDFIETEDQVYIVFELPGYNQNDVDVSVKGKEIKISASKTSHQNTQEYLIPKLNQGMLIRKTLPDFVNPKKFSHTMRNGILEVIFIKK